MKVIMDASIPENTQFRKIYEQMTRVREEMHELEEYFGMIHELTVAKSQELDRVINEYMCMQYQVMTTNCLAS